MTFKVHRPLAQEDLHFFLSEDDGEIRVNYYKGGLPSVIRHLLSIGKNGIFRYASFDSSMDFAVDDMGRISLGAGGEIESQPAPNYKRKASLLLEWFDKNDWFEDSGYHVLDETTLAKKLKEIMEGE